MFPKNYMYSIIKLIACRTKAYMSSPCILI